MMRQDTPHPSNHTVLVHPFGNENVRQTLSALSEHQLLASFVTSIGWTRPGSLARFRAARSLIDRRLFPMVEDKDLHVAPARELVRNVLLRAQPAPVRRLGAASGPLSAHWVAHKVETQAIKTLRSADGPRSVYGYSTFAARVFEAARPLGMETVLEVPHVLWASTSYLEESMV